MVALHKINDVRLKRQSDFFEENCGDLPDKKRYALRGRRWALPASRR